jgi:uncharacterized cupredoxin-like copper-binding protein
MFKKEGESMKRGLVGAVLIALAAFAVGAANGSAGSATATVKVTLKEFTLKPATTSVQSGKITFAVVNRGRVDHELVVLRTKGPASKLPLASTRDVYEVGRVGKTPRIDAGRRANLTLTLKPGHYSLICNLPGHYRAGQFADFTAR